MPTEDSTENTQQCGFVAAGPFGEPPVNVCPSCGGDAISLQTPTRYRCAETGEVFYVEL